MSLILILFLFNSFSYNKSECSCAPAIANEVPTGANVDVETRLGKVKKLNGLVSYEDGTPVENAIVEVFDYKKSDKDTNFSDIPNLRKRRTACKVFKDGRFCFPNLPAGTYLLRAGTVGGGINFNCVKVTLAPLDKKSSNKKIRIALYPGT